MTLPVEDDRAAEELLRLTCEEAIRFLADLSERPVNNDSPLGLPATLPRTALG